MLRLGYFYVCLNSAEPTINVLALPPEQVRDAYQGDGICVFIHVCMYRINAFTV